MGNHFQLLRLHTKLCDSTFRFYSTRSTTEPRCLALAPAAKSMMTAPAAAPLVDATVRARATTNLNVPAVPTARTAPKSAVTTLASARRRNHAVATSAQDPAAVRS